MKLASNDHDGKCILVMKKKNNPQTFNLNVAMFRTDKGEVKYEQWPPNNTL